MCPKTSKMMSIGHKETRSNEIRRRRISAMAQSKEKIEAAKELENAKQAVRSAGGKASQAQIRRVRDAQTAYNNVK
jgi:hypothetical protein